jgi:hypothetical protein
MNPDAIIVRANLARGTHVALDSSYLASLSADAAWALAPRLTAPDASTDAYLEAWSCRMEHAQGSGLASFNLARARAEAVRLPCHFDRD